MTELIDGFYPTALDAGIAPFSFWDYTLQELKDLVESYNRNFISSQKLRAMHGYKQAQMIASYVSLMLQSDGKEPEVWDFYPDIFSDVRERTEQLRAERELEEHKARMRAFAERTRGRFKSSE
ncbi:hypothetical protein [Streptococcus acidominimus]|uniref:Uncharacterized protein n=1 Tax=Streptococcus acidominimus TaxID=1326 RepID=A0A380IDB0_STRAI|nr:hypothetical protein [Streptococcus acidominimus]SUN05046.1 Uncharacterised protein [Streptococcus acidominimus]